MASCAYIESNALDASDRIALLRQHQIPVANVASPDLLPEDTKTAIMDGSATAREDLLASVGELARLGVHVLVIFQLSHGEAYRTSREDFISAGAADVMETGALPSDFLIRTRALLRGARPPFVLVVEDNEKTGPWVVHELERSGLEARCVPSLEAARACYETMPIDAMVVDRNLPDGDGLDFIALLRRSGFRTPALLFTALESVSDRVRGLTEAGADDYVCKPVHGDELVARVQVLLKPRTHEDTLIFGPLELGRRDQMIRWRGRRVELRPKEGKMLIYLAEREGLMIPKRMIYADVWEKTHMDVGSNPVNAARHRLVRDFKALLESQGETWPDFLITDGDMYGFRADRLQQLPMEDKGAKS